MFDLPQYCNTGDASVFCLNIKHLILRKTSFRHVSGKWGRMKGVIPSWKNGWYKTTLRRKKNVWNQSGAERSMRTMRRTTRLRRFSFWMLVICAATLLLIQIDQVSWVSARIGPSISSNRWNRAGMWTKLSPTLKQQCIFSCELWCSAFHLSLCCPTQYEESAVWQVWHFYSHPCLLCVFTKVFIWQANK